MFLFYSFNPQFKLNKKKKIEIVIEFKKSFLTLYLIFQYADQNRHLDALNAWRNATVLKPDHSLAWNNMVILLDNTGSGKVHELTNRHAFNTTDTRLHLFYCFMWCVLLCLLFKTSNW